MNNWQESVKGLQKTFVFQDFRKAMVFMVAVSYECEALNHHPDWQNIYNTVHVCLNTHDQNGAITHLDYTLAGIMDTVYNTHTHDLSK